MSIVVAAVIGSRDQVVKLEELKMKASNPALHDKELETKAALNRIGKELHQLYNEQTQLSRQSESLYKVGLCSKYDFAGV